MTSKAEERLKRIGERIKRMREGRGLTQSIALEIRDKYAVKLDPSYLSRLERGQSEIPLRTLFAIADYFQVTPAQFLDPATKTSILDFLADDFRLLQDLQALQSALGPDRLRQILAMQVSMMRELSEAKPSSTVLRAARNDGEFS